MERGNLAGASDAVLDGSSVLCRWMTRSAPIYSTLHARPTPSTARRRRTASTAVRPVIQQVLDAVTEATAWVRNAPHDIVAMNLLARALFAPVLESPLAGATGKRPANTTRFDYLNPAAEQFFIDYDRIATDAAAMLRLEAGRNLGPAVEAVRRQLPPPVTPRCK
jgi:hypothetical protein